MTTRPRPHAATRSELVAARDARRAAEQALRRSRRAAAGLPNPRATRQRNGAQPAMTHTGDAHLLRVILDTAQRGRRISRATLDRLQWIDSDAAAALGAVADDLTTLAVRGRHATAARLRSDALEVLTPALAEPTLGPAGRRALAAELGARLDAERRHQLIKRRHGVNA